MKFTKSKVLGSYIIDIDKFEDDRGFVAYGWSARQFLDQGIDAKFVEMILSFNVRKGTLRGMHYQNEPFAQAKLVRCTRGAIFDVAIDLRRESPTFKQWDAVELTAQNRRMLYIPEGCAHGFQTLADDTEVLYQVSNLYAAEYCGGVRWDDPAFGVAWPDHNTTMIARDRDYPDFGE